MTEGNIPEKSGDEIFSKPFNRRNFFKLAVGVGVGGGAVVGGAVAAERSLEQGNIDEVFRIGHNNVRLTGQDFIPKEGISDPEEAVLFLVGAPMRANASVTWGQPRALADRFKVKGYTLDARPVGNFDVNSIDLEVEAIRQFIEKNGIKKITVFGHSIGAVKAVNLAASLEQNNPDIQINGVVLANPMGFYDQSMKDLLRQYPAEVGSESKLVNPKAPHESVIKTAAQLAGSIVSDIIQTNLGYPKWVREQFQALTKVNPNLAKVKAPVVILLGSKDLLAESGRILPAEEIEGRTPAGETEAKLPEALLKKGVTWEQLSLQEQVARLHRKQIAQRGKVRNQYIQERMPNAQKVQVIVAEKHASHIGFTVERVDKTSHVVSGIFDRLRRPQNLTNKAA